MKTEEEFVAGVLLPVCSKCGCLDIHTRHMPKVKYRAYHECENTKEHLHRFCRNCSYEWDDSVLEKVPDGVIYNEETKAKAYFYYDEEMAELRLTFKDDGKVMIEEIKEDDED
jgi:hypothetical protein